MGGSAEIVRGEAELFHQAYGECDQENECGPKSGGAHLTRGGLDKEDEAVKAGHQDEAGGNEVTDRHRSWMREEPLHREGIAMEQAKEAAHEEDSREQAEEDHLPENEEERFHVRS